MRLLRRAWSLYLVTILVTLSFAAMGSAFGLSWAPDLGSGGVKHFVLDVITLHRTIFLADILLMYTVLVLAAGPVILLLSRGHTWAVLAGSWLLWAVWQVSPDSAALPWPIRENSVFHFSSWQVLFFTGVVIGWHRAKLGAWVRRLSKPVLFGILVSVSVVVVGGHLVQAVWHVDAFNTSGMLYDLAFDKPEVPIGRILALGLWMVFAFALTTLAWGPIRRAAGWLLLPLGQNALTAYVIHVFLVGVLAVLNGGTLGRVVSGAPRETARQVVGLLVVWLLVLLWMRGKGTFRLNVLAPVWSKLRPAHETNTWRQNGHAPDDVVTLGREP